MVNILVVEDSLADAEFMVCWLQSAGLKAIVASSSEEALVKIQQQKPDAIVLDVILPGASGFELCRELKANKETAHIPIVMCSCKDGEMDKFWGLKQGASFYLVKPINPEELIRTMKIVMPS